MRFDVWQTIRGYDIAAMYVWAHFCHDLHAVCLLFIASGYILTSIKQCERTLVLVSNRKNLYICMYYQGSAGLTMSIHIQLLLQLANDWLFGLVGYSLLL